MVPQATILNIQFIMNGMPLGHTQDNTPSSIIITGHYSLSWLAQFRLLKLTVNLHSNKSSMSENIQCKQCPNVGGGDNLDFVNKPNVQSPCNCVNLDRMNHSRISLYQSGRKRLTGRWWKIHPHERVKLSTPSLTGFRLNSVMPTKRRLFYHYFSPPQTLLGFIRERVASP